jgi:hypothetical protein
LSLQDAIKASLGVFFLGLLSLFYAMFVVFLALYLKIAFGVAGLVTVFALLAPPFGVWAWILHEREVKSGEAQAKGFQVSPEIQARTLDEYERLLKKKEETES